MIYLVLLLSIVFRLVSLNQSLWLDEATTALVAKMPIIDFFTKFMPGDFHPPLYYLIVHYWSILFGMSEISLRVPSILFGVLTVYVVYLIAKATKFKWPVVPALFLATSGLHIYYSQEARMYAMAAFLVTLVVLFFIKKQWILFSVFLSMLFLTDYLSILILPALFIYSFVFDKKSIKKLFYSVVPLLVTFLAWSPIFLKQLASGVALKNDSSGWWGILGSVNIKNILLIPTKFIIGRVSLDDKMLYSIIISLLLILFGYLALKTKNKLIWSWFGISFVLGVLLSLFIPTLTYFRYLFILPAFYLLISENISKKFVAIVLFINILTSGYYLFNNNSHREDWREVSKVIGSEKVVFPVRSQTEALTYYGKEKNIITKTEITGNEPTLWLSRYVWNIFDNSDSTRLFIEKLGYNMTEEVNLNGVVFWKYTKLK